MSANEVLSGFEYLYSTLSADATLTGYAPGGIWRGLAPPGTATPFIVMSLQSGSDVLTFNAIRLFESLLYLVKVVGPASNTAGLANAAAEIDALLKRPPITVTADGLAAILAVYREQVVVLDELVSGTLWTSIAGLYRMEIQQIG